MPVEKRWSRQSRQVLYCGPARPNTFHNGWDWHRIILTDMAAAGPSILRNQQKNPLKNTYPRNLTSTTQVFDVVHTVFTVILLHPMLKGEAFMACCPWCPCCGRHVFFWNANSIDVFGDIFVQILYIENIPKFQLYSCDAMLATFMLGTPRNL